MPREKPARSDHTPRVQGECIGRDEMNLAEFPIAMLSHRANTQTLTLHKERQLKLPDGREIRQEWTVTGTPEYGLPQPCDEDVLLGLLKIASDTGFDTPRVHFTQRALLHLICWPSQAWSHQRLEQALARLTTTKILAKNSFWDKRYRRYRQTLHFGIIDSYEMVDREGWKNSSALNWARFSDEFFDSIQVGYIKPLSFNLYFSLESSVTKRLFRYLDKKRHQKTRFEIRLHLLATVHVGLSPAKCRYPSSIKEKLAPAHDELVRCGFLESVDYDLDDKGEVKVIYTFGTPLTASEQPFLPGLETGADLIQRLVEAGVNEKVARELVRSQARAMVERQLDVVVYLLQTDAASIRNPGAFLAQSIREGWTMQPPGYLSPAERARRAEASQAVQQKRQKAQVQEDAEAAALEQLKSSLSDKELARLRSEALAQVQGELGHMLRVHEKSPFVEVALNQILRARLS